MTNEVTCTILVPSRVYFPSRQGEPLAYRVFAPGRYQLHIMIDKGAYCYTDNVHVEYGYTMLLILTRDSKFEFLLEEYVLDPDAGARTYRGYTWSANTPPVNHALRGRKVRVR